MYNTQVFEILDGTISKLAGMKNWCSLVQCLFSRCILIKLSFKALEHFKDFHQDFSEKIVVKIVVHI